MITLAEQQREIQMRIDEINQLLLEEICPDREDLQDELNGLIVANMETRTTMDGAKVNVIGGMSTVENNAVKTLYEQQTPEETAAIQQAVTDLEVQRLEDDLLNGPESEPDINSLKVLGQKPSDGTGDFVFNLKGHHGTGTDAVFAHVHKDWVHKCISFEEGKKICAEQQAQIEDFPISLGEIKPVVATNSAGQPCVGFAFPNGRTYIPTKHAMVNLSIVDGPATFSTWQIEDLMNPKGHATKKDDNDEPVIRYQRDEKDVETLIALLNGTAFRSDRTDMKKKRLFRTWKNGTLRAVLSEQYAIVNNLWLLDVLFRIIPGGLLSHWKGDADSIYGNILIPDTIRQESDSDYGGMVSIGNSEIGLRRVSSTPSVFRSICMNGCIWGGECGEGIRKKHRGEIDLKELEVMIRKNIQAQIPLLTGGIDSLLKTREFDIGNTELRYVIAEVASKLKLSKVQSRGVFEQWAVEKKILGMKDARTLFGIVNAITRYSQIAGKENPEMWVKFDTIGGELMNMTKDEWDKVVSRAGKLDDEDMKKIFGE